MFWLMLHEWVLLLLAFLIGTLIGWWIASGNRKEEVVYKTHSPQEEPPQTVSTSMTAVPQAEQAVAKAPKDEGTKPLLFSSPLEGPADDLKKISGIGPKYEDLLNEIGIYYYAQIRDWSADEITWLDNRLEFPGRIRRDKWQQQASVLADGGKTEFANRYDKGETPSSYDGEDVDSDNTPKGS